MTSVIRLTVGVRRLIDAPQFMYNECMATVCGWQGNDVIQRAVVGVRCGTWTTNDDGRILPLNVAIVC